MCTSPIWFCFNLSSSPGQDSGPNWGGQDSTTSPGKWGERIQCCGSGMVFPRIRLRILKRSGSYPCYLSIFGNHKKIRYRYLINNRKEESTNYLPFSVSHWTVIPWPKHRVGINKILIYLSFLPDQDTKQIMPSPDSQHCFFQVLFNNTFLWYNSFNFQFRFFA